MNAILSVCLLEMKRFKKSIILLIAGFVFLSLFPLTLTPLVKGSLWSVRECIYTYLYGFCGTQVMFVPIFMIALYYQDSTTDIAKVIFTQPLNKYQYAFGKFLSVFLLQLIYLFWGLILLTFVPVKFGKLPYSPLNFIKPFFVYYIPTSIFICSICYLTVVIFKNPITGFFLPLLVYMLSAKMSDARFQIIINGTWLDILEKGTITIELQRAILTNRFIITFSGILLLFIALLVYSPKSYINKGGRI